MNNAQNGFLSRLPILPADDEEDELASFDPINRILGETLSPRRSPWGGREHTPSLRQLEDAHKRVQLTNAILESAETLDNTRRRMLVQRAMGGYQDDLALMEAQVQYQSAKLALAQQAETNAQADRARKLRSLIQQMNGAELSKALDDLTRAAADHDNK